ncbi:ABC transporter ATP-binding protein [Ramlibacter sp. AN1015]|uniref:ABC transporter ATP-binding protein n=1 Tax=Ramlibacter sp. AN1015 TaxID=3133428 RepID=UPI0030BD2222
MSSPDTLVRMHQVSKQYPNGTVALKGMTLDIRRGEFVSFLGPSGCGKSTALRMLAGLASVTAGRIEWPDGGQSTAADADSHPISFVFQEPTLMPWSTVFDNVYLPLRLKGATRRAVRDEVMATLDAVGLASFADVYPRELSGGMKMRVSIARAIITRPRLLLMDEPFAALDEMTRNRLNDDVLRLWAQHGLTVVFVTHSIYESVYLSNRIVVMAARPGRVIADLPVDAPYPREASFRTSPEYGQLVREVTANLHGAIHDAVAH